MKLLVVISIYPKKKQGPVRIGTDIHEDEIFLLLTHLFTVHPFSVSWKYQKISKVFVCFHGVEKGCIRSK